MCAESPRIILTGFRNAEAIRRIIDVYLIDIGYVDEITPKGIFIVPDANVHFGTDQDFEFVKAILVKVINENLNDQIVVGLEGRRM